MPFQERGTLQNFSFLNLYGTDQNGYILRLTTLRSVKNSDISLDKSPEEIIWTDQITDSTPEEKLDSAVCRARSKIWELAMCNDWDYFFTVTLDPKKYDRFDLDIFHEDFTKFLYEYKHRKYKIQFLIIPEQHESGAWHFHGLLFGLPKSELQLFRLGDKMSKRLVRLIRSGRELYSWSSVSDKFGFNTFEPVNNYQAVCKYVTKYINKDIAKSVTEFGAHTYFRSRGLNERKYLFKGFLSSEITLPVVNSYKDNFATVCDYELNKENIEEILSKLHKK